jgi:hypothetical protein
MLTCLLNFDIVSKETVECHHLKKPEESAVKTTIKTLLAMIASIIVLAAVPAQAMDCLDGEAVWVKLDFHPDPKNGGPDLDRLETDPTLRIVGKDCVAEPPKYTFSGLDNVNLKSAGRAAGVFLRVRELKIKFGLTNQEIQLLLHFIDIKEQGVRAAKRRAPSS